MLKGNAIIGQSGGPTSVINSSLAGVIEEAKTNASIERIYGMNFGIEGLMENNLVDLGSQPDSVIKGLRKTPSSSLGSSRHKVTGDDLPRILGKFKEYNIRYFFLIGGNDTMDTINRVEKYCHDNNYEIIGIGIPKTVDNDLAGTDHTPGYASAARSNILNVMQAGVLANDMRRVDKFVVYQTIGRDAGWLAASTALAKRSEDDAPHLIYMPEFVFNKDQFLADVEKTIARLGWVSVVCGEGIKYSDGTPVSSSQTVDKFSNIEFGAMGGASVGLNLHSMISKEFGIRGEFQIPESLIMSDFTRASSVDLEEAFMCGVEAVKLAARGDSGYMITIDRISDDPYNVSYGKILLSDVAEEIRPMPAEYFNSDGNGVSEAFIRYLRPLISGLPSFVKLQNLKI